MRQIDIPGGTATLRERQDIRQRDRKPVMSAGVAAAPALMKIEGQLQTQEAKLDIGDPRLLTRFALTAAEMESFQALQATVIVACLAAWSLPETLPTLDTVEDLPAGLYAALAKATEDATGEILNGVSFEPPAPSSPGFEESPTVPSVASGSDSRAETGSESTEPQKSGGTSSNSGASSTGSPTMIT